jgi:hypothetical protein
LTSSSDVSISLERKRTWGERPAPSIGTITATPRRRTRATAGR